MGYIDFKIKTNLRLYSMIKLYLSQYMSISIIGSLNTGYRRKFRVKILLWLGHFIES